MFPKSLSTCMFPYIYLKFVVEENRLLILQCFPKSEFQTLSQWCHLTYFSVTYISCTPVVRSGGFLGFYCFCFCKSVSWVMCVSGCLFSLVFLLSLLVMLAATDDHCLHPFTPQEFQNGDFFSIPSLLIHQNTSTKRNISSSSI